MTLGIHVILANERLQMKTGQSLYCDNECMTKQSPSDCHERQSQEQLQKTVNLLMVHEAGRQAGVSDIHSVVWKVVRCTIDAPCATLPLC